MIKNILKKIKQYQTIIIHRHLRPDLDAFGSQLGLKEILQINFPRKDIYVVGDMADYPFSVLMDEVDDRMYQEALVFILDTSDQKLVSDARYLLGKELIIIDHHLNDTNLKPNIFYKREEWVSCSEIIADFALTHKLKLDKIAASHLLAGIIGDSGRFNYVTRDNASHAFYIASELMKYKVDIKDIYDFLYVEPLAKRQGRALFADFKLTDHFVAYRFNDRELIEKSGFDFFTVSRGMIGGMAGIKEVPIWANFTESETGEVVAELRSRLISIVDIAKKYGGGGHANACGATLQGWSDAQKMINELDERARTHELKNNLS